MCDCNRSPVRAVLERFSVRQVESARQVALERSRNAKSVNDRANAVLFANVAQACDDELADRLLMIATRSVLDESVKQDHEARDLVAQMAGGGR